MNDTLPKRSCDLATWSLVLGIIALVPCFFGLLFAIPAVICGHKALGRIKRSGGTMQGSGSATAGLAMGYVGLVSGALIFVLSLIAIPNFLKTRQIAQRNTCINNLRVLDNAKEQWALENEKPVGTLPAERDLLSLLPSNRVMPACPAGGTYDLRAIGETPVCSKAEHVLPE